ncbi:hypothetical protein D3C77_394080 [compost metagenome]
MGKIIHAAVQFLAFYRSGKLAQYVIGCINRTALTSIRHDFTGMCHSGKRAGRFKPAPRRPLNHQPDIEWTPSMLKQPNPLLNDIPLALHLLAYSGVGLVIGCECPLTLAKLVCISPLSEFAHLYPHDAPSLRPANRLHVDHAVLQ